MAESRRSKPPSEPRSFFPLVLSLEPQIQSRGLVYVTMFPLSLLIIGLATIGAYAKPTIRAVGGLEVSLSTPADKVPSVSDLRVVANVKNVGDEDVKVLKFGTVLDNKLPTRSFIVTKDGKEAAFTGIRVRIYLSPLPSLPSSCYVFDQPKFTLAVLGFSFPD